MGGWGRKSWGGPKENLTMIGGGSLCVFCKESSLTTIHVEDLNKFQCNAGHEI